MDKVTGTLLEKTGLIGMIGKAERGPAAIEAIRKHNGAVPDGGRRAAYLVAKAIKASKVVGFDDLGMEAIYEFEVKDMPSLSRSALTARRCIRPGRRSGRRRSARFRWPRPDARRCLGSTCCVPARLV